MIELSRFHNYSLFGGLLPEEVRKIENLFGFESYKARELVQAEGTPNDRIRFVMSGRALVSCNAIPLALVEEGDFFGEMEVLGVMTAVASVHAETALKVATISNRALHEIYKLDAKIFSLIMMNLGRDLSRRLRRMDELHCERVRVPKAACIAG